MNLKSWTNQYLTILSNKESSKSSFTFTIFLRWIEYYLIDKFLKFHRNWDSQKVQETIFAKLPNPRISCLQGRIRNQGAQFCQFTHNPIPLDVPFTKKGSVSIVLMQWWQVVLPVFFSRKSTVKPIAQLHFSYQQWAKLPILHRMTIML